MLSPDGLQSSQTSRGLDMRSLNDGATFLLTLEPGLSTSLAMWVIPVKYTGLVGVILGLTAYPLASWTSSWEGIP
jgi:hypothetical protein